MDGDQAAVAGPVLGRLARWVPPESLSTLLADLLQSAPKVTARKEAARLIARHRGPDALATLTEAWQRRNQHRDVKTAIAVALIAFLDDGRAWQVLEASLAESPDAAVRLLKNRSGPGAATPSWAVRAAAHRAGPSSGRPSRRRSL
ncbi:HEAT repeat domain-containing protein [Fodinicola feengrottensis]|uniref:HEAT repeat domain-containing protein n=1 Tax=Fodinicola feengrottensis TaxID=435914 RepID=UPI0013D00767|nr:HEAT repeat domain-containing protein [Fodinicola feengrottensis]